MLRKIAVLILVISIMCVFTGCKKSSDSGTTKTNVEKTASDYSKQAEKSINKKNAADELDKLESEINADN